MPLLFTKITLSSGNGAPVVLLLFTAGPLDVTFAQGSPSVQAILQCFYPAEATGEALRRVLTATGPHSVPAARLPNTWPAQLHQVFSACSWVFGVQYKRYGMVW